MQRDKYDANDKVVSKIKKDMFVCSDDSRKGWIMNIWWNKYDSGYYAAAASTKRKKSKTYISNKRY